MGRAYPRVRKAPVPRRCLGFALQPLPRATAAATQGRRAGCCCSSTPAAAARGSGSSRCRTSPKASPPPTPTTGFRTGAGARPPSPRSRFPPPDPRRVRALRLKLFPPEFVTTLYCTPAGWTPGGKGFARAACAADSEYHVLVPSEAWSGLLSGRGTTCPYPQPPAGLAKEHIRVALTAQGVRYAVLAQVGTLEATPAFRLSAAGLHERLSSTVVAGGPCLRREPWRAVIDFLNFDFWFSAGFFLDVSLCGRLGLGGQGGRGKKIEK